MENLTRYSLLPHQVEGFGEMILMCSKDDGEYVKFSDIKDLLQTSHNNARVEICPHYIEERVDLTGEGTNFEVLSCCRTAGKLSPVA